jgi:hypothetical protein
LAKPEGCWIPKVQVAIGKDWRPDGGEKHIIPLRDTSADDDVRWVEEVHQAHRHFADCIAAFAHQLDRDWIHVFQNLELSRYFFARPKFSLRERQALS